MIQTVICILTNLFRVYLICQYINIFSEREIPVKYSEKCVRGIAFSVFFLANTGCYLAFHSAWINFIINLVGVSLLTLMYHKSIKISFFISCSVYFINMVCDALAVLPFVNYKYGYGFNQFYEVISVLLFFFCELATEKMILSRKGSKDIKSLPLAMMLVPVSSIITFGLLMGVKGSSQTVLLIVSAGFWAVNFLLFYLYNLLLNFFVRHYENEILRQKVQVYKDQIAVIVQNEEQMKLLKHDMKHHLNEIKLLAMQNQTSAILEYVESMEAFMQNPDEFISSGNMEVDCLMNYMIQRARNVLRSVQVKIQIPEGALHSFDINIVLGNLLENAIEAAEHTEEKTLDVLIQLKKGILTIEIKNSFSKTKLSQNQASWSTTKENRKDHGFGLKSAGKIIKKYHGTMKLYSEGELFCVKAILYMSEIELSS